MPKLLSLIKRKLGLIKPVEVSEEDAKKKAEENLNQMIVKAAKLRRLIKKDDSGWSIFFDLLKDYQVKQLYLKTRLVSTKPEDLEIMRRIEEENRLISFILMIPDGYINKTEEAVKKNKEKEDAKE